MTESNAGQTPPGWYPDPEAPNEFRHWDGQHWAPYADDETRRSALAVALGHQAAVGGVVADRGDYWAIVTAFDHGTSVQHGLHAVLTLLTCGLWLPVWIVIAVTAKGPQHRTYRYEVDRSGRVQMTELK